MKIKKNKAILFICSFFCILFFITLLSKFFGHFKSGLSSWEEIGHYLPLSIICSLGFAAWTTWGEVGDDNLIEFFTNRRKNKKSKEK